MLIGGPAFRPFNGTSASSPIFACVVALLNDARMATGMSPLGFLNPWIYSEGFKRLNDITRGGSTGCDGVDEGVGRVPFASWNATEGWDPVTGESASSICLFAVCCGLTGWRVWHA